MADGQPVPDSVELITAAATAASDASARIHAESLKAISDGLADTINAITSLKTDAISGLRDEFRRFRDVEFVDSCGRNDRSHTEILAEVRRVNGDVGGLKLWKSKLEGAAIGLGMTGKLAWMVMGVLISIGLVVLGAALAHGAW